MKSKILKSIQLSVIAASMLASCLALSNAYAKDAYLKYVYPNGDVSTLNWTQDQVNTLKKKYGDIGFSENYPRWDSFTGKQLPDGLNLVLHGALNSPKWGAFTVGVIPKDSAGKDLEQQDRIFNSQEEATQFCKDLVRYDPSHDNYSEGELQHYALLVESSSYRRVVMVPYTIAYDHNSQEKSDGTSTPALKYVMCPNYSHDKKWILDPNRDNENEATGIASSKMIAGHYQVTCMPAANKPVATFWFSGASITNGVDVYRVNLGNLTNLHQYNKLVGAQYCPQTYEDTLNMTNLHQSIAPKLE